MDEQAFPAYLQDHLNGRDWTRADLARESGIGQSRLSRWMTGEALPGIENARHLANALGRPLLEVLVVARLITKQEARLDDATSGDPRTLADEQLITELRRRLVAGADQGRTFTDVEVDANPAAFATGRSKRRKLAEARPDSSAAEL